MPKQSENFTASEFLAKLHTLQSPTELKKYQRFFKFDDQHALKNDKFIGVKMGQVFSLAKEYVEMAMPEIQKLLQSEIHEGRVGAVSIMDYQARSKKTSPEQREALFDLYINQHDRINTWDLVDRSVIYVVGDYLVNKPRQVLYDLAKSTDPMRRRSAILATAAFIRHNDLDDTYKIAEILLRDENELVHKGVGWMLRFAGDKDPNRLQTFLDQYAVRMPRIMLRYAIEKLEKSKRDYYLKLK